MTTKTVNKRKPNLRLGPLGKTSDGVTVLRPKLRPTHFTMREISAAVKSVLKATEVSDGQR